MTDRASYDVGDPVVIGVRVSQNATVTLLVTTPSGTVVDDLGETGNRDWFSFVLNHLAAEPGTYMIKAEATFHESGRTETASTRIMVRDLVLAPATPSHAQCGRCHEWSVAMVEAGPIPLPNLDLSPMSNQSSASVRPSPQLADPSKPLLSVTPEAKQPDAINDLLLLSILAAVAVLAPVYLLVRTRSRV